MAVLLVLLSTALFLTQRYSVETFRGKVEEILQSCARTFAENDTVRQALRDGVCPPDLMVFIDDTVRNTYYLDYVTIADENSIRIYHIDHGRIGQPFIGSNQERALAGEHYLSNSYTVAFEGQRQAFHPVFEDDGTVLGFVMTSSNHTRIEALQERIEKTYMWLYLILTLFAMVFCGFLAYYLGKHLRGVRTDDLLRVYLTQNDIINALDEGLISFDTNGQIRLVNAAACRMLGQREDMLVGRQVDELIRTADGKSLRGMRDDPLYSNRSNILVQPIQLPDANLWAREVLILADKTELARYTEELGGTRHMVNTLRANNHEFMNQLQVISGLLQMDYVREAQDYIGNIASINEHIISPVMRLIHNPNVAALILGKSTSMRELDIELRLLHNSALPERSLYLSTREIITVVGNLLENAMEAVNATDPDSLRIVVMQITEDENGLYIMVNDTGTGIREEDLPHIFKRDFSTKASSGRGVGMTLIKEITDRHGGSIEVESELGSGTTISIIFSRERGALL